MNELIIILLILILYSKTYKHYNVIDDICDRKDYLVTHTQDKEDQTFYEKRRTWWTTVQCIGNMILVCLTIDQLWGWQAALLYAVFPMNTSMGSWRIGSILYGNAALLTLITHLAITKFGYIGLAFGVINYFTAVSLAVSPLFYPFFLILTTRNPEHLIIFLPLIMFLSSKRFRQGLKKRVDMHQNLRANYAGKFEYGRLICCIKVIAYYLGLSFYPRQGFFHDSARYIHNSKLDRIFVLSIIAILAFIVWSLF